MYQTVKFSKIFKTILVCFACCFGVIFMQMPLIAHGCTSYDKPAKSSTNKVVLKNPSLNEIGEKDNALLVFTAKWCGSCQKQDKALTALKAKEMLDVPIVYLNYDSAKELKKHYDITATTTLVLVKKGNLVAKEAGLTTKKDIKQFVSKHLEAI